MEVRWVCAMPGVPPGQKEQVPGRAARYTGVYGNLLSVVRMEPGQDNLMCLHFLALLI